MTRLGFLWAKLTGDEAGLGPSVEASSGELAGRRVALVGNARSLAGRAEGAEIDAADLVVRLNAAPLPSPASHGTRTDWIALSVPVDEAALEARAPARVIWMTPRRRRLPWRIARRPGFALAPVAWNAALAARLGARPSTGAMAIDLLARSPAAAVAIHGFDFFATRSLSGSRDASAVPHDFAAERAWVDALVARDPRLAVRR